MSKLNVFLIGCVIVSAALFAWMPFKFFKPHSPPEESSLAHAEHSHSHGSEGENLHDTIIHLSDKQVEALGIHIQQAAAQELNLTLSSRGKIVLHPDRLVHILPKVAGVAKEARKNIGNLVKESEIIAILESREMADTKAAYLAAMEKEKLALSQLERETRLFRKKITAEQDYIQAKSAYSEALIHLQLAKQKLKTFGLNAIDITNLGTQNEPDLSLYDIRSPMDGQVISRHITQGEFVETTTIIYEIANLSEVWVEMGIYPKDLFKVGVGQWIEVSQPNENLKARAKIIYVSPLIEQETITSKAVAQLANSDLNWRPGSFVNVTISTDQIAVPLAVATEAIQSIEGEDVVFVKITGGFEARAVQTGKSDDHFIEITQGLELGEAYAASKAFLLKADLGKSTAEHEH